MAGYKGYSMSNNAVSAYESGEKPYSRWTKADILEELDAAVLAGMLPFEALETADRMKAADLKSIVLQRSSWHHTSKFYNRTNFYTVDPDRMKGYLEEHEAKNHPVSARCRVCIGKTENGDCVYEYRVLRGYETSLGFTHGGHTYLKCLNEYELI